MDVAKLVNSSSSSDSSWWLVVVVLLFVDVLLLKRIDDDDDDDDDDVEPSPKGFMAFGFFLGGAKSSSLPFESSSKSNVTSFLLRPIIDLTA